MYSRSPWTGTTGISKVLDAIGGPSGIILYILVIILYIYTIYNKLKKGSPLTLNLGTNSQPGKKGDPEKPNLINDEHSSDEDTKPLRVFNRAFRPTAKGPRSDAKALWNPMRQVDPTSI